ncbi:Uncharacterised protein [uncultured archaeon]|nr:Uncharacterised protein [uncultured archaeon]
MNKKYAIGVIIATAVAIGIVVSISLGESSPKGPITGNVSQNESISTSSPAEITKIPSNATARPPSSNPIKNTPLLFEAWPGQYDVVFPLFQKYLKSGDSVFIQGNPTTVQSFKTNYFAPRVNVQIVKVTGNLANIEANSGSWPGGYDVWRYIYESESQYEPQFTVNQAGAQQLWDKAREYLAAYNTRTGSHAKLWVVASWPETSDPQAGLAPWNWGQAQQHTDLLTVEVHRWQENNLTRSIDSAKQVASTGTVNWQAQTSMEIQNGHTLQGAIDLIEGAYSTPGVRSWEPFYSNNYEGLYTFLEIARGSGAPANPPAVSITENPSTGPSPLTVNYSSTASGGTSPYTYSWLFDDNTVSTLQNPSHTYQGLGNHDVVLKLTDNDDVNAYATSTVNVTSSISTNANYTSSSGQYQKMHFIFIAWESQYSKSFPILQKYLVTGDSVFLQTNHPDRDASYKSNYFAAGVNVYLVRKTFGIQDMISNSTSWPSGYDLWEYDYEKGNTYEPQFTPDQAEAEKLFDQAMQYVQQYNQRTGGHAKLWITPSYPEVNGQNWNWGEAQQHADLMLVQVQRWQESDPARSITAAQHVAESAGSWIVQASISGQHTVSGALNFINGTSGLGGIKSYLVFYGNNYDGLESFLQQVR